MPKKLDFIQESDLKQLFEADGKTPKVTEPLGGHNIVAFKSPPAVQSLLANTTAVKGADGQLSMIAIPLATRPPGTISGYESGLPTIEHWFHLAKFGVLRQIGDQLSEPEKTRILDLITEYEKKYTDSFKDATGNWQEISPKDVGILTEELFAKIKNKAFKASFEQKWQSPEGNDSWMTTCIRAKASVIKPYYDYLAGCAKEGIMPIEVTQGGQPEKPDHWGAGKDGKGQNMLGCLLLEEGNIYAGANAKIPDPKAYYKKKFLDVPANVSKLKHDELVSATKKPLQTLVAAANQLNNDSAQSSVSASTSAAPTRSFALPPGVSFQAEGISAWLWDKVRVEEELQKRVILDCNAKIQESDNKIRGMQFAEQGGEHSITIKTGNNTEHKIYLEQNQITAQGNDLVPSVFAVMAASMKEKYAPGPGKTEIIPLGVPGAGARAPTEEQLFNAGKALIDQGMIPKLPANQANDTGIMDRFIQGLNDTQKRNLEKAYTLKPGHDDPLKQALTRSQAGATISISSPHRSTLSSH